MQSKPTLIVIYNHRYDENIEKVENIYKSRFSNIYHLMPDYSGNKSNVIPVYGHSHYFHSFIVQGLAKFYSKSAGNYIFLHDDLILNPVINENNYLRHFNLNEWGGGGNFLLNKLAIHQRNRTQWLGLHAFEFEKYRNSGVMQDLPIYAEAIQIMQSHGITIEPIYASQLFPKKAFMYYLSLFVFLLKRIRMKKRLMKDKNKMLPLLFAIGKEAISGKYEMSYPFIGSNADLIVVDSSSIKKFVYYCGILAKTDLFVEIALPTALALSATKIVDISSLTLKRGHFWEAEPLPILAPFQNNLQKLLENFPEDYLYLHPVKLSKWS